MPEQNMYTCPHCGAQGIINAIMPVVEDVRYDAVSCDCGAKWRVYYKFKSPKVEVLYTPPEEVFDSHDEKEEG